MSLVAYAASSDEDSDYEENKESPQVEVATSKPTSQNLSQSETKSSTTISATNGHISDDDDDDYAQEEILLDDLKPSTSKFSLSLPKPKHVQENTDIDDIVIPTFAKLPMPRPASKATEIIEEVDDEFLHKKAVPPAEEILQKPPPPTKTARARVQITIPSLKDFKDVEQEQAEKSKNRNGKIGSSSKGSGLLSNLPPAKSERNFAVVETKTKNIPSAKTTTMTNTSTTISASVRPAFVPDTVRNRRPAYNTEGIDSIKAMPKKPNTKVETSKKATLVNGNASDSDASDDDDENNTDQKVGDFFSLNAKETLPEVSTNEINALVAKRAAQIAEATDKYLNEAAAAQNEAEAERMQIEEEEMRQAQKRYHEQKLDTEAMDALVGKNAKRRRKEAHEMQVIDISSSEVLPDREEWMRTALTSATTYQPTGVLNDEEPVAGTRRKHQITYLAHKAKSNEAELQAIWAANRQTRRATQSKYGF